MGVVKFANGKRNQGIAKRIYTKGEGGTGQRKKKKNTQGRKCEFCRSFLSFQVSSSGSRL